ncbi:hypothetical protein [Scopulibacillus cellulosilyticus]|uniref:Uncharacterized protein n=1 Tax=Scopulibacillus cellulosilyticus TaxID=2665665 RepID=A0ABW2PZM6_9BACL
MLKETANLKGADKEAAALKNFFAALLAINAFLKCKNIIRGKK